MTFRLLKHEYLKTVVICLGCDLDCVETVELVHLVEYVPDQVRLSELNLNAGLSVNNIRTALHCHDDRLALLLELLIQQSHDTERWRLRQEREAVMESGGCW